MRVRTRTKGDGHERSPSPTLDRGLSALVGAAGTGEADAVRRSFQALVSTYRPEAAVTGGDGTQTESAPEVAVLVAESPSALS